MVISVKGMKFLIQNCRELIVRPSISLRSVLFVADGFHILVLGLQHRMSYGLIHCRQQGRLIFAQRPMVLLMPVEVLLQSTLVAHRHLAQYLWWCCTMSQQTL